MCAKLGEALTNGNVALFKKIMYEIRFKSGIGAKVRTETIDKCTRAIIYMELSPLAKYLLFSSQSDKGIFNNLVQEKAMKEGMNRKKKMSKIRSQVGMALGQIDDFELFQIELNAPMKVLDRVKEFEPQVKEHYQVFKDLV